MKDPHFNASFARFVEHLLRSVRQILGKKTLLWPFRHQRQVPEFLRPTLEAKKRASGRHCRRLILAGWPLCCPFTFDLRLYFAFPQARPGLNIHVSEFNQPLLNISPLV